MTGQVDERVNRDATRTLAEMGTRAAVASVAAQQSARQMAAAARAWDEVLTRATRDHLGRYLEELIPQRGGRTIRAVSIWGRRVDAWANRHLGQDRAHREDYYRAGGRVLLGLVLIAVVLVLLFIATAALG